MLYILAMAQPPGGAGGSGGSPIGAFMPLILIFIIFYFLLIRPQQKKQKEHQKLLSELQKGDKIITTGGIHGVIVNIKENVLSVKIAENVRIDISRGNVAVVKKESKS